MPSPLRVWEMYVRMCVPVHVLCIDVLCMTREQTRPAHRSRIRVAVRRTLALGHRDALEAVRRLGVATLRLAEAFFLVLRTAGACPQSMKNSMVCAPVPTWLQNKSGGARQHLGAFAHRVLAWALRPVPLRRGWLFNTCNRGSLCSTPPPVPGPPPHGPWTF